jgi:uncharacterized membrane protein
MINLVVLVVVALVVYPTAVFIIGWFGLKLLPVMFVLAVAGAMTMILKRAQRAVEDWRRNKQGVYLRTDGKGVKL